MLDRNIFAGISFVVMKNNQVYKYIKSTIKKVSSNCEKNLDHTVGCCAVMILYQENIMRGFYFSSFPAGEAKNDHGNWILYDCVYLEMVLDDRLVNSNS
jgi:hypothetical protein